MLFLNLLEFVIIVLLSIGLKFLMSYIYPITLEFSLLLWFLLYTIDSKTRLYNAIAELINPPPTLSELFRINNIEE